MEIKTLLKSRLNVQPNRTDLQDETSVDTTSTDQEQSSILKYNSRNNNQASTALEWLPTWRSIE